MERRAGTTLGGEQLRALRKRAGATQFWVELEAEIGSGYLQRIESGRVALPERSTIEQILNALAARYLERREILEAYGYTVTTPLPDVADRAWATAVCQDELHEVLFPAYVLDCTHQLIAWNSFFPRLLGLAPDDPTVGGLAGHSLPEAWFDPNSSLGRLVAEPDAFLPTVIHALRYEMERFHSEAWTASVLARLEQLPRFRHYWAATRQDPAPASVARAVVPLRLNVPGVGMLQFRLSSDPFVRDARFRLIYYLAADPATMRQCAAWAVPTPNRL
ncbi:MAG: helix-turn-helix domain-containing protein [Thermomicrobiales bacterium]